MLEILFWINCGFENSNTCQCSGSWGLDCFQGVQPFGVSGPHWKKSCLGPHIKYIVTRNHKKNVLSVFNILCWASFPAILGCTRPEGCRLDTPAPKLCPAVAWYAAQTHPAVLWVYREGTGTQKPRKKTRPSQTQCSVLHFRSGFHFLYTKSESNLCYIISESAEQEVHLPPMWSVLSMQTNRLLKLLVSQFN